MKTTVSVLVCWLAALVSVPVRQEPPSAQIPAFRTGIDAVQLDVSVLDKDRRPVRGLTAADFTVLDDGKPRQIVAFSAVELPEPPPASPAGAETIPPDVTRNELPDGRIVIILLDPFLQRVMVPDRVTIADPPGITALRATAVSVVNGLGPGDLAAVGHTMYGVPQNFTTDKARLRRAIRVTTAPFRGSDGRPMVMIATGVRANAGPAVNGRPRASDAAAAEFEPIEILTSAFRDGKKYVDWQRQRVSVAIPDTAPGQLRYETISTLALEAGTYEVRVAARHEKAGEVGSVHTYVDVPDFGSDAVTLSGVVLLDPRAPTATPAEALAGILDTAPTTRRDFSPTDEVSALVRVYPREQPSPVTVSFRVLGGDLQHVVAAQVQLQPAQFAGSGSADARYRLPLGTLQPGSYVLRVEADARPPDRRDIRFTVR